MTAREQILEAISQNQPAMQPLPEVDMAAVIGYEDVCLQFQMVLESIGAKVERVEHTAAIIEKMDSEKSSTGFVINTVSELGAIDKVKSFLPASHLEKLERAYFKGSVGVAENGAVWLSEDQMLNRLLPFVCEHLVLLVERKDIVATLHQAYEKIDVAKQGYGVFIAGPSKTADIEQSLVIGAHGARSATIYIIG